MAVAAVLANMAITRRHPRESAGNGLKSGQNYPHIKGCKGVLAALAQMDCWQQAKGQGGCHCKETQLTGQANFHVCRCGGLVFGAMAEMCTVEIPQQCDPDQWNGYLWQVYGAATIWVSNPNFNPLGGDK